MLRSKGRHYALHIIGIMILLAIATFLMLGGAFSKYELKLKNGIVKTVQGATSDDGVVQVINTDGSIEYIPITEIESLKQIK